MLRWIIFRLAAALAVPLCVAAGMLFVWPRPADTTAARVFTDDAFAVDYCDLPILDGSGLSAAEIPKAFTPGCGWEQWPAPILANCTEPLPANAQDLRGLWQSVTPGMVHLERVEQCGNRVVVVTAGIIHDFVADGSVKNGSRDIEPPTCMNTWAAVDWRDQVLSFRPFGLSKVLVTRELQGDQLVWQYPRFGEVRMERRCRLPSSSG